MIDISQDELKSMLMEAWVAGWYDKERVSDEEKVAYVDNVMQNIRHKIKDLSSVDKRFIEKLDEITRKDYDVPDRYAEMCDAVREHYNEFFKDIFDLMKKKQKELEEQLKEAQEAL